MDKRFDVVVVGSINWDFTYVVDRLPAPGETVTALSTFEGLGGKGANQAVAAARQGATSALVATVGDDEVGALAIPALVHAGVDVSNVQVSPNTATGRAIIDVDRDGENFIVVLPGANNATGLCDRPGVVDVVRQARVVLLQGELPPDETYSILETASQSRSFVLLNPAPVSGLDIRRLRAAAVIVPNEREAMELTSAVDAEEAARAIWQKTGADVVVTRGAQGVLSCRNGDIICVPAPHVDVIDTTGAGDAFCGCLAAALARGAPWEDAIARAQEAGALATTTRGAVAAIPRRLTS